MIQASWFKRTLQFTQARLTSRNVFETKPAFYIRLHNLESGICGVGECGLLPGLSIDDRSGYEDKLNEVINSFNSETLLPDLIKWPSINFGVEMAQKHLQIGTFQLFTTPFSQGNEGIEINGLVWMSTINAMLAELKMKLDQGFTCVKIKIGSIDFHDELKLLQHVREHFPANEIMLRLDANGAFGIEEAQKKLDQLSAFDIDSIEQPIMRGQWQEMARLCEQSPIPIALDEELIGISATSDKEKLIETIKPQCLVLKPSLLGGFATCDEWIALANSNKANWWATSALESNIGLNAIAQYTASKESEIPQGLGTGLLYKNNINSPLEIRKNRLWYADNSPWHIPF